MQITVVTRKAATMDELRLDELSATSGLAEFEAEFSLDLQDIRTPVEAEAAIKEFIGNVEGADLLLGDSIVELAMREGDVNKAIGRIHDLAVYNVGRIVNNKGQEGHIIDKVRAALAVLRLP